MEGRRKVVKAKNQAENKDFSAKTKKGRWEGDGEKMSRQFAARYCNAITAAYLLKTPSSLVGEF